MNVDKTKVDVTIGRTAIHGDKPVQLAWNKDRQNMTPLKEEPSEFEHNKNYNSVKQKSIKMTNLIWSYTELKSY